jgi:hypothetical protein
MFKVEVSSVGIRIYIGNRNSPPASAEVKKKVDLYIHSPLRLHDVVIN